MYKKLLFLVIAFSLVVGTLFADNTPEEKNKFNASETILHHILDSHEWELFSLSDGHGGHTPIALDLPWILYSSRDGLAFYSSTEALNESGLFQASHGKVHALKSGASVETHTPEAHTDTTHAEAATHAEHHDANIDENVKVYDFSITKTSLQMIIVGIVMLLVFSSVAKGYAKNRGQAPTGAQSMFEPVIMFVRDLAKEYLGAKHEKFLPYLLTLFFFIWFSNLFGLTPLNSNIAGNIAVTCALALLTLVLIVTNATKDFWMHILLPPGVPPGIQQLLTVIELLSNLIIKPVALAIRLFANIAAGHFMVLSLISLIFILGKAGESVGGAISGAAIGVPFAIIIFCLEMLVAIVQAYIFTLLTTVFISMAMESHDDHHHAHDTEQAHSEVNKDLRLSDFGTN